MRFLFIFNIISLFYFLEGSTPINFTFGYHAGYDDNEEAGAHKDYGH